MVSRPRLLPAALPAERRRLARLDPGDARGWARDLAGPAHPRADEIALAVHEAVVNALEHGGAGPRVLVEVRRGPARLAVGVQQPLALTAPTVAAGSSGESERGRGLALIDALCDGRRVGQTGDGHVVWLTWDLAAPAPDRGRPRPTPVAGRAEEAGPGPTPRARP